MDHVSSLLLTGATCRRTLLNAHDPSDGTGGSFYEELKRGGGMSGYTATEAVVGSWKEDSARADLDVEGSSSYNIEMHNKETG